MEVSARGWHVYGKTVWQSPRKGEKLTAEKENNKEALDIDPYAVAWMLKRRNKLIPDIVGHVPREISRFIWFFFTLGGKMEANVWSVRPLPSPIPSGGLEIMLMAKLTIDEKDAEILKYLQQLIAENYEPKTVIENDETDTETNITDQSHENEKEEGHDIDDLIFIDDDTDKEEE